MLASILALAGCASVPSEIASQMQRASEKYASVSKDMTKAELVATLGAPQKEEESKAVWEVRFDFYNYDSLTVEFGGDGRIARMTKSHGRGSWGPRWSSQRSYAYDK